MRVLVLLIVGVTQRWGRNGYKDPLSELGILKERASASFGFNGQKKITHFVLSEIYIAQWEISAIPTLPPELNKSSNIITLYLTIKGLYNFTIDFHRGGIDKKQAKQDYENAIMYLSGGDGF